MHSNISHPYPASVAAICASLKKNASLIKQMARRDVTSRYRGSALGMVWSFITPLLSLAVYSFIFGFVFTARGGGHEGNTVDFAFRLFVGLIVHGFFMECIGRAPSVILHHSNFVKKVVFPLEIFPFMLVSSALFHFLMSFCILLTAVLLVHGVIPITLLMVPVILLPFLLFTLGVCWILCSAGVYVRDIGQLMGLVSMLLMFLSPVFYPASALPAKLQPLLYLNPLTWVIEALRGALLQGVLPAWGGWTIYSAVGLIASLIGFWWFQRSRHGFADVL